jgi:hypothetical protein
MGDIGKAFCVTQWETAANRLSDAMGDISKAFYVT